MLNCRIPATMEWDPLTPPRRLPHPKVRHLHHPGLHPRATECRPPATRRPCTLPVVAGSFIVFGSIQAHISASGLQRAHTRAASVFPCLIPKAHIPTAGPTSSMLLFQEPVAQSLPACACHASHSDGDEATIASFLATLVEPTMKNNLATGSQLSAHLGDIPTFYLCSPHLHCTVPKLDLSAFVQRETTIPGELLYASAQPHTVADEEVILTFFRNLLPADDNNPADDAPLAVDDDKPADAIHAPINGAHSETHTAGAHVVAGESALALLAGEEILAVKDPTAIYEGKDGAILSATDEVTTTQRCAAVLVSSDPEDESIATNCLDGTLVKAQAVDEVLEANGYHVATIIHTQPTEESIAAQVYTATINIATYPTEDPTTYHDSLHMIVQSKMQVPPFLQPRLQLSPFCSSLMDLPTHEQHLLLAAPYCATTGALLLPIQRLPHQLKTTIPGEPMCVFDQSLTAADEAVIRTFLGNVLVTQDPGLDKSMHAWKISGATQNECDATAIHNPLVVLPTMVLSSHVNPACTIIDAFNPAIFIETCMSLAHQVSKPCIFPIAQVLYHDLPTHQVLNLSFCIAFDPGGQTNPYATLPSQPHLSSYTSLLKPGIPHINSPLLAICYTTLALPISILLYQVACINNKLHSHYNLSSPSTISNPTRLIISSHLRGRMSELQAREIIYAPDLTKSFKARPLHRSELLSLFIEKSMIDPG